MPPASHRSGFASAMLVAALALFGAMAQPNAFGQVSPAARPFLDAAGEAASARRYVDALAAYANAIAASPDASTAYIERARLFILLGHADLAALDYRHATKLSPADASLQNDLCLNLALANHDLDGALAACDTAVRLDPANYAYLSTRGYLNLRRGAYAAAEKDYAAALALSPASPGEMYGYGIALIHLGQQRAGRGEIASATLDSSGLVSEWETRGFGMLGEIKPGKPLTAASQPIISISDRKILLNADEEYIALASACGRIVATSPAAQRAAITQANASLSWSGDCRFGLIHGECKLTSSASSDTPSLRFAYGREITADGAATVHELDLAYQAVEHALGP